MKIFAVLISALTSFVFALTATAATSPVGSSPGSFAVSPSGAATYTIPIQVPPGVNGMQPNISLVYNSQAGNGIAGVGWNIGGLSEITRCGATIDRDGYKGGVDLTPNDKFCLDGQRLIYIGVVTLPQYSGSGCLEYRTEIETFNRVISCPAQGNGPAYFRVMGRDGSTTEYGYTPDSRGYAQGNNTVLEWSVSKIQDALGNYVQFVYNADSYSTGEHWIDRIEYTLNGGAPIGGATRKVQFVYESRSDSDIDYFGRSPVRSTQRLKAIQSYAGVSLIRDYRLSYQLGNATQSSRLTSLTECAGDGVCFSSPLSFTWSDSNVGFALGKTSLPSDLGNTGFGVDRLVADVNGDGKSDVVETQTDSSGYLTIIVFLSDGVGYYRSWISTPADVGYKGIGAERFIADVNGDGKADIVETQNNGYLDLIVFLSDGVGYHIAWASSGSTGDLGYAGFGAERFVTDVNGDGRDDVVETQNNGKLDLIVFLSNGTGFTRTWASNSSVGDLGNVGYGAQRLVGDVNGDGKSDVIVAQNNGANALLDLIVFLSDGTRYNLAWSSNSANGDLGFVGYGEERVVGDVNGDGKVDVVVLQNDAGRLRVIVFLSDGIGYRQAWSSTQENLGYKGFGAEKPIVDVNGDGFGDIVQTFDNGGYLGINVFLWNGTGYYFAWSASIADVGYVGFGAERLLGDSNGDGKIDIVETQNSAGLLTLITFPSVGAIPDRLEVATGGMGAITQISYKTLTDTAVYSRDTGAVYPVRDLQFPMQVVSSISASNGIGGTNTTSYTYAGMKEHQLGRGNLGFRQMTVTGPDGSRSTTTFAQQWPFIGMPVESKAEVYDPTYARWVTVSSSQNYLASAEWTSTIWNNTAGVPTYVASPTAIPASASLTPPVTPPVAGYFSTSACSLTDATRTCLPFVDWSYSLTKDFGSNTAIMSALSDSGNPDRFGNVSTATSKTSDGYASTTTNIFYSDESYWRLGLLTKSTVSNTVPAAFSGTGAVQTLSRKSIFVYELPAGTTNYRLKTEVVEPATDTASTTSYAPTYTLGALTAVTGYEYDATYGFRNKVTASGNGITARSTSTAYVNSTNPGSLYPEIRVTNALGHTETTKYDARFGVPLTLTGPNNLTTAWEYDGFGRKTKELRADGTATTIALNDCGTPGCYLSSDLGYARYSSTTRALNTSGTDMAPAVTVYYDILGRELRTETLGFNGSTLYKDTVYDSLGRVKKSSRPYFNTQTAYWTTPTYDALGRAYQVTTPDGAITTTTYNGLSTTVQAPSSSDGKLRKRTETKNSQGQLVTVTDALNSVITYKYDAFGNLTKVINPVPAGITATSNTITTTYDIRGRKTAMTDPDMSTWTYTYNVLGEMLTQKDAKNQTATMTYDLLGRMTQRVEAEGTSTWTYDTAANGKGKLASVTGPTNSYSRSYVYDSKGRVSIVGTSINGTLYNMSSSYDPYTGRVTNVQFPATVAGATTFAFYNNYNARGFLEKVTSGANGAGTVYWQVNASAALGGMDAEGNLTGALYGNGVSTTWGYDPIRGLLTDIDTTGPKGVVQSNDYTYYSGVPNMQSRGSNVAGYSYTETFAYDELNRLTSSTIGAATKSITYDVIGNIRTKTGVGTYTYGGTRPHAVTGVTGTFNGVTNPTYTYDANGNQLTGAGRTLTYTSFNLPKTVATSSITQSYAYDAEHGRIVMTQGTATTVYINPRWDAGVTFEKETNTSGVTEYKHYIYAGSKPVAMHIVSSATPSTPKTRYLHTDHLGSVEAITSEDGTVLERFSFDPWGKRRNANGTDATTTPTSTITKHGYTGHEMVDAFGLVNMNGRWYDPSLARVMQADPLIQAPAFLDSYNRYTYVWNNPLSNTDPSGFETWMSKRKWKRATRRIMRNLANTEIRIDQSFGIDGVYEHRWNKTYRVGGLLVVGATATPIGTAYAWSNNDWETVNKGHATIAVMVAAFFLMPAAPAHPGFWAYAAYIGQSMAVSYGSSYATARIWGASASQAHQAGIASARTAALFASMRLGYEYMKTQTNYSSALSRNTLRDPKDGDLFTYGGRPTVNVDGSPGVDQTWFPGANMTQEVDGQQNGFWDIDWMRQFFNRVSKVHDYGNSWAYDMMGNWISRGPFLDTLFQAYSGSTMVPAAAYMVAANYGGFTDMAGGVNQNVRTNW